MPYIKHAYNMIIVDEEYHMLQVCQDIANNSFIDISVMVKPGMSIKGMRGLKCSRSGIMKMINKAQSWVIDNQVEHIREKIETQDTNITLFRQALVHFPGRLLWGAFARHHCPFPKGSQTFTNFHASKVSFWFRLNCG